MRVRYVRNIKWTQTKKKDEYNTCPFDLCVSNVEAIIECLNNDFKDFCNPEHLKYDKSCNILRNTKYNFEFNHESPFHGDIYLKEKWVDEPYHFVNNNYKNFCDRYNIRIRNFHNYCNGDFNVVFILQFHSDKYSESVMNKLNEAILKRYPNLKYSIKRIEKNLYHNND